MIVNGLPGELTAYDVERDLSELAGSTSSMPLSESAFTLPDIG